MKSRDVWARRVKRRLERAGFKVSFCDPRFALEQKRAARELDLRVIGNGEAKPDEIQKKNSVFGGQAKAFRIVDYGGLNDPE